MAEGPADFVAVDAGEHEIEEDEVGVGFERESQAGLAV